MKKNSRMWHTVNNVIFLNLKTISTLQPCPFLQCDSVPVTLQQRMAKPRPKAAQKHLRHLAAGSEEKQHETLSLPLQSWKRYASHQTNQYRAARVGAFSEHHTLK